MSRPPSNPLAVRLALIMAVITGPAIAADLDQRLQQQLSPVQSGFVGHEAVTVSERSLQEKYLILDFRLNDERLLRDQNQMQASVHIICTTILSNRQLLSDLSQNGFSRVAVAFDERSQYDCL